MAKMVASEYANEIAEDSKAGDVLVKPDDRRSTSTRADLAHCAMHAM